MSHLSDKKAMRQAEIISNGPISGRSGESSYLMQLRLEADFDAAPGQFIQIQLYTLPQQHNAILDNDGRSFRPWQSMEDELRGKNPLLNRPFSLAGIHRGAGYTELSILYKSRGPGTGRMTRLRASDEVTFFGPLGHGVFTLPEKVDRAVVAGGGLGTAGLLYWTKSLVERGISVSMVAGSVTADDIPLPESLRYGCGSAIESGVFSCLTAEAVDLHIATDDGTVGTKGYVSEVLEKLLSEKPGDENWAIYACGPWPMLKLIAKAGRAHCVPCQVSLEEMMACGIGTCQACVIRIRTPDHPEGAYELCCSHGPVFEATSIDWESG